MGRGRRGDRERQRQRDLGHPELGAGGIKLTVSGSHTDGALFCDGSIVVKLDGGLTSSPLGVGALLVMLATAAGMLWTWLPRP